MAFNITQIINKFVPIKITGTDIALPVDVQFSNLKATSVTFTSGLGIRDTKKHWIATNQNWSYYKRVVLRVDNTHNQPLNLFLNLQGIGHFHKLDGTRQEIVIPANTSNILVTPSDWEILGETIADSLSLGAQCSTSPTTGALTVVAYFVPLT